MCETLSETCSTDAAAAELGLARSTVAAMVRDNRLIGVKTGREYRIDRVSLARELERRAAGSKFGKTPLPPEGQIGTNIDRIMRDKGMTQAQLAAASGVWQSKISVIIRGKMSPALDCLQALAAALGVDVAELYGVGTHEIASGVVLEVAEVDGRPQIVRHALVPASKAS